MRVFRFYTYDRRGNDITLTFEAESEDQAWSKFVKMFGLNHPVDMVREI